jgi:hypothetical protein
LPEKALVHEGRAPFGPADAPARWILEETSADGDAAPDQALAKLVHLAGPELVAQLLAQRTPRRRRMTPVMLGGVFVLALALTGMLMWALGG